MKLESVLIIFYYIIMAIYLLIKYTKFFVYGDLSDLLNIDFINIITILFIKIYLIAKIIQLGNTLSKYIHKIIE